MSRHFFCPLTTWQCLKGPSITFSLHHSLSDLISIHPANSHTGLFGLLAWFCSWCSICLARCSLTPPSLLPSSLYFPHSSYHTDTLYFVLSFLFLDSLCSPNVVSLGSQILSAVVPSTAHVEVLNKQLWDDE